MGKVELKQEILSVLDHLSKDQQERLLVFIRSLLAKSSGKTALLELAGTIDTDDIKRMEDAIADCEKIDPDEW